MRIPRLGPAVSLIAPAILAASLANVAGAVAAVPISPPSTAEPARFAVALPLRNQPQLETLLAQLQDPASPQYHKFLTQAQFASRFGPTEASKEAVATELRAAGFRVVEGSVAVYAHGTEASAEKYFGTRFAMRTATGATRAFYTPLGTRRVSPLLTSLKAHVIGLDGLPDFHSNAVFSPSHSLRLPLNLNSNLGPYLAPDLKQAYSYPSYAVATGAGTSIGIISSSPVNQTDINEYFEDTGDLAPGNKVPTVVEFPIDGGGSYSASGAATGEVTLDVEMSAGSAPGAEIGIFNTPDLSSGNLLEAYDVAVEAGSEVVSSSIGGCEKAYNNQVGDYVLEALHTVFEEGSAVGTTFVGASGDNAAWECGTGTATANLSVQTPTDDPIMIGVGGTTQLVTTYTKGSDNSAYISETSNDTPFTQHGGSYWGSCGGYSVIFAKPSFQSGFVGGSYRGVPDLAMHMGGPSSTDSTDLIIVGGNEEEVSGTSAAAPEFAGLLALKVQIHKGPIGDPHPYLYALAKHTGSYRTGIHGGNGYPTTSGLWDPVLGLGTPYGRVIDEVSTAALAGVPGTASNP
jgi:subtilase family serine protease